MSSETKRSGVTKIQRHLGASALTVGWLQQDQSDSFKSTAQNESSAEIMQFTSSPCSQHYRTLSSVHNKRIISHDSMIKRSKDRNLSHTHTARSLCRLCLLGDVDASFCFFGSSRPSTWVNHGFSSTLTPWLCPPQPPTWSSQAGYEYELTNEQLLQSSFPYTPCWLTHTADKNSFHMFYWSLKQSSGHVFFLF